MLNKPLTKFNTYYVKTKNPFKNTGIDGYFLNVTIKTQHIHIHIFTHTFIHI